MIVLSLILLVVVGSSYGCMKIAKTNPDIISGFKMSDDAEQRERDKVWLELFQRDMHRANVVTLVGGIAAIVLDLQVIYFLSLVLPLTIALSLAYCRRKTGGKRKTALVLAVLTAAIIVCLPLVYASQSNLEVSFPEGKMKIGGIYGKEILLSEIKEARLCRSLPEISIRTNGFALGKTRIGHFRTTAGKGIMLFTHSDACFIRIVGKDDTTYYLSCREENETRLLFLHIQEKRNSSTVVYTTKIVAPRTPLS